MRGSLHSLRSVGMTRSWDCKVRGLKVRPVAVRLGSEWFGLAESASLRMTAARCLRQGEAG